MLWRCIAAGSPKRAGDLHLKPATLRCPGLTEMRSAVPNLCLQVAYNAQMIRTWSLLLRTARRTGYLVAGRQDATPLSEHTFIMHPVEAGERPCFLRVQRNFRDG
jgi:hypothetical protein